MTGAAMKIYKDIASRTNGDVYLGVVGPVRTGKSTFVRRFMETLVIPNMDNIYLKERAKDELPQSGSGKTIMTSEPKFVPEDAAEISPDGSTNLSVRLIDSVGYLIPGALGAEEEGKQRMITTPWFEKEIAMEDAAEIGTKKVMEDHCTIGIVITTDGTICDIPRSDYVDAERRAIADMKATGKPFLVLVNSVDPNGECAQTVRAALAEEFGVTCLTINCLELQEKEVLECLSCLLSEFPIMELQYYLPKWMTKLPLDHPVKSELFQKLKDISQELDTIRHVEAAVKGLDAIDAVDRVSVRSVDPGTGIVLCDIILLEQLFYQVLSGNSGFSIKDDGDLMILLEELAAVKKKYDRVSAAIEEVQATGYGVVMPSLDEMCLEAPEIVRKGSNYGVRLKASAPSIHMMRTEIETEISPMVGDEKQSEDLLNYLLQEYEGNTKKMWNSNIFGKSVFELVNESLTSKLKRMPTEARCKFQNTLTRIINEGSSGLLCIIFS